ncbi:glycosyltransferase family 2 protein [Patescibacteria group bacterium]
MEHPKRVSVIVPAYNAEPFVADAVNSVLRQSHPDLEVIVVNDGSTDGTATALSGFGEAITVITQANHGQSHARNVGLRRATGAFIGFLDADDLWTESHLSTMLPHLLDGRYDFVRSCLQYVRHLGTPQEQRTPKLHMESLVGACLYTRDIVDRAGPFDESMRQGEDCDWQLRVVECGGREKRLDSVALLYRRHDGNITNARMQVQSGLFETLRNRIHRQPNATPDG